MIFWGCVMKKAFLVASVAVYALVGVPAQAASLIGDEVTCQQVSASSSFVCNLSSATVGTGTGSEFEAGNVGGDPFLAFDFVGNSLRVFSLREASFGLTQTVINFTNLSNPFSSASLQSSSIDGFISSDVSLNGGVLSLDFRNTNFRSNSRAMISLQTISAVPEPATWTMLILGLLGIGATMRTARRKQNFFVSYS